MPSVVLAANPTVTITVSVWVVGAPSGLVITYISDTEVQLDWVKGLDAENTMIRAKFGSYPTSRTEGYQVYYGDGITATDTGVNFDEGVADVYYSLYSQNADGIWEEVGTGGFLENPNMFLAVLAGIAIGFLALSLIFKRGFLSFGSAGVWLVAGIYCFSRALEYWDVYFSLGFLFMAFVLACAFAPLAWRETTPANEATEEPDALVEGLREEMGASDSERGQWGFLYKNRRPTKRKMSRYERTGER
jgi:hypothetical protein